MIKLDRSKVRIIRKSEGTDASDDGFIAGESSYLLGLVWQLTRDAWSFRGDDVEQRLQRHIVTIHRRKS